MLALKEVKMDKDEFAFLISQVEESWKEVLKEEFETEYFKRLLGFLSSEYANKKVIFPPIEQIHSWSFLCPLESVKVVILGQDPYHNVGQAMGLAFSVPATLKTLPPSLINIYKELEKDIDGFVMPKHGCLVGWASQGVLLLNASLTVRAHEAASHAGKGWENFTDAVFRKIARSREGVVFMLWGAHAQKKGKGVIDRKKHLILEAVHPSPLSAHRGFFGCKHFSKANAYLETRGKKPIDWTYLPTTIENKPFTN